MAYARSARELVPELRGSDLVPGGAGVRAQAVGADGRLVDDFAIQESPGFVHVLNAPLPGGDGLPGHRRPHCRPGRPATGLLGAAAQVDGDLADVGAAESGRRRLL